ncbi:MAG: 50S ribosomal protein L19 [Deltaproteobacteria bacterium]|jgi:large subunit ribosomal protein L19|nr:50S ribosomal protein L19 [Deltaproteobacteria bacterium]
MNIVDKIGSECLRKGMPEFRPGDTLRVHCKIKEGEKERVQVFEGVCIRRRRGGVSSSFTVRKISYGVGVERIFPFNSPQIDRVDVVSQGKVRRSRLYYLRDLTGKAARIQRRERDTQRPSGVKKVVSDDATAESAEGSENTVEA